MERIERLESGNYRITGELLLDEPHGYGEAVILLDRRTMRDFLEAEINRLADERLRIMIEHQRHELLVEQRGPGDGQ